MTILKHGDYQGEVTYEDGVLVVRLLHIDDLVVAECNKASDAQALFEDLVDDYIETCQAVGKEPCKPFRGSFNVRIDPATHRQIARLATEEGISLNTWVARAIDARASEQKIRREALNPQYLQRLLRVTETSMKGLSQAAGWQIVRFHQKDNQSRRIAEQFHSVVGHG